MDETFDTLTSPMKSNVGVSSLIPSWMHLTWTAMTERTSTVILLNSSKQPQAPGKCQDFQSISAQTETLAHQSVQGL